jgi:hypothetical protein
MAAPEIRTAIAFRNSLLDCNKGLFDSIAPQELLSFTHARATETAKDSIAMIVSASWKEGLSARFDRDPLFRSPCLDDALAWNSVRSGDCQ